MRKFADDEERPQHDYSFDAMYRRAMGSGSLVSCVSSFRQSAWNLDDAGIRPYSQSLSEAMMSVRTSESFKKELQRQEKHGGKKAIDDYNRGCRNCDELNYRQSDEQSPEERDLNLELLPYFTAFTKSIQRGDARSRLESFDRWHMTFRGVCFKRKMSHLYDEATWMEMRKIHEQAVASQPKQEIHIRIPRCEYPLTFCQKNYENEPMQTTDRAEIEVHDQSAICQKCREGLNHLLQLEERKSTRGSES